MNRMPYREDDSDLDCPKWLGSPVTTHALPLKDVDSWIPTFERRVFGAEQRDEALLRINSRLDTIVRLPFKDDKTAVPIGVVSKKYSLVQHRDVLEAARKALTAAGIEPSELQAELQITKYGERMALSIFLPDEYSYKIGERDAMSLRLELWNSVDRSIRLRVLMGWFRLVCSNGLIIGVMQSDVRRRHVNELTPSDVEPVLRTGITQAREDSRKLSTWRSKAASPEGLRSWIDGNLKNTWGFKAAARAYHIACTGRDCDVRGPFKDVTPTTANVRALGRVPGTPQQSRNLFDVSQILAWLAKERRDLQEQLEWREQIAGLMAALVR